MTALKYSGVNSRLKVLQIGKFYPPHHGGMETHLRSLCRGLSETVDVRVLVSNHTRRTRHDVVDGIPVTRLGQWVNLSAASICPGMSRRIRQSNPDLVHIHHPNPPAILAYMRSGHRGPVVLTYQSDIIRQRILGPIFELFMRRFLRSCDRIIASSQDYIESSPILSEHRARCAVVPLGTDLNGPQPADDASVRALRAQYGPRIVLSVGRLVYYKGFDYLIRAMARIDGRLLIAGDGPLRSELEQLAASSGVRDKVVFLGTVRDVQPFYQGCDVFVLPSVSRNEAYGLVQLEAMACGKPVVNTNLASGVRFVSPGGVTGLTEPPRDEAALAGAVSALLADERLRARFGAAARRRVEDEFTNARMVERTLEVYAQVLHERLATGNARVGSRHQQIEGLTNA